MDESNPETGRPGKEAGFVESGAKETTDSVT